jgi:Na+/melibiose symporter-like transporter
MLSSTDSAKIPKKNSGFYFICLSQFGLAFCFNVVMSFMPFYIIKISPYSTYETMIWIGMIMGLNSFVAAATAPVWGSLTAKFPPKRLFQSAFLFNADIAGASHHPGRTRRRLHDRFFHDFKDIGQGSPGRSSEPLSEFHDRR